MTNKKVLISGSGIAGLTLAILLKEKGWNPTVIERDSVLRKEGYMMDFFGTGWDVAERMNLIETLKKFRYPIEGMQFVDGQGEVYSSLLIKRITEAFGGEYTYLRRPDLEQALWERADASGIVVRYSTSILSFEENPDEVSVTFENGEKESFSLVVGADGVHSRVRELVFGPEDAFGQYLGYYVAAFHINDNNYHIGTQFKLYEEPDKALWVYPLGDGVLDAVYVFRSEYLGRVAPLERIPLLRKVFEKSDWLAKTILDDVGSTEPVYFDSATQIVMPSWSKGHMTLVGDACACLTLLSGQGSQMAMAGAYVLAQEIVRHEGDHAAAFKAYEDFLRPKATEKQETTKSTAQYYLPSQTSSLFLRRLFVRILFSKYGMKIALRLLGFRSVLAKYR